MNLRGRLVELRRPAPRDEAAFLAAVERSRTLHRPWVFPPAQREAYASWLARGRRANTESHLVCRRDDGEFAGVINLNEIVRGAFQSAFAGFYAFAGRTRRGEMTEGLQLVVRRAFGELKLHRIEANIQPGNERSIALVRRAGFVFEGRSPRYLKVGGRWRDHEHWVRLRS